MAPEEPVEPGAERREGIGRSARDGRPADHRPAQPRRAPRGLGEEARLPDPELAGEEQHRRSRAEQAAVDRRQFALASDEWPNHALEARRVAAAFVDRLEQNRVIVDGQAQGQASYDPSTHQASWTLTSIDPSTGALTTNPLAGFLPPDTSPPLGEGYVTFQATPLPGLTTGTTIDEQATVAFGINAPIQTDVFTNTIDAGAPTSSVAPLPSVTSVPNFTVSWSGTDDPNGSGVGSYDLYVSIDGQPFIPWLLQTTQTSAIYPGTAGHSFGFYSVARDNAGNVQPTPSGAQTSTIAGAGTTPTPGTTPTSTPTLVPGQPTVTSTPTITPTQIEKRKIYLPLVPNKAR